MKPKMKKSSIHYNARCYCLKVMFMAEIEYSNIMKYHNAVIKAATDRGW